MINKLRFGILSFLLITMFSTFGYSFGNTGWCYPQIGDCDEWIMEPHTSEVRSWDLFSTCTFVVSYNIYICDDEYYIEVESIFPLGDCDDYWEYMLIDDGTGTQIFDFNKLVELYELMAFDIALEGFQTEDPDDYRCPINYKRYNYFIGSCYSYCITFKIIGGNIQLIAHDVQSCGDACCQTSWDFCYDENNDIQVSESKTSAECEYSNTTPILNCPVDDPLNGIFTFSEICISVCSE